MRGWHWSGACGLCGMSGAMSMLIATVCSSRHTSHPASHQSWPLCPPAGCGPLLCTR
jgi:hypothetical protein